MSRPALLAVAHGSRNPGRRATCPRSLARQIAASPRYSTCGSRSSGTPSRRCPPQLGAAGSNSVIVPLLLSTGYHLSADIDAAARTPGHGSRGPLGPDQLLLTASDGTGSPKAGVPGRDAGGARGGGVVRSGRRGRRARAGRPAGRTLGVPVGAFATAAQPTVPAVAELRQRTGRPVAVASYLLAPGHFQDQLATAAPTG